MNNHFEIAGDLKHLKQLLSISASCRWNFFFF